MSNDASSDAPQVLRSSTPLGSIINARGWRWRLENVRTSDAVSMLEVVAVTPDAPQLQVLLLPFDDISPAQHSRRWHRASRARLRRVVAALDGSWPDMPLTALAGTSETPWPHQLVPALVLTTGRSSRLLLADEVGLGKTLSAALVIAELSARALARRVLVLTPAGLRDQWCAELGRLRNLEARVIDAAALAARVRDVPPGVSPWMAPGCAILSMDFAKKPTVLHSLGDEVWDILVVDEAHGASSESQRAAAVRALAARSRVVLLLTATPHTGDADAFRKLLSIGSPIRHGRPLTWIRRDRPQLGYPSSRRTRVWRLRPSDDEAALLRALHAYAARIDRAGRPAARLAMIVLKKRALSSPDALACSLRRRLAHIAPATRAAPLDVPLPFDVGETNDEDVEQPIVLGAAGLLDASTEVSALERMIALADRASRGSAKHRAIERIVRRTGEAIVLFTEYRDTLDALVSRVAPRATVAVLHGGLDRVARREAVRRFTTGQSRILIATDAAAEGLNLQARCRFVVHIELPWSPAPLEQRAGRVDRLGQRRAVRVWQLAGASGHEKAVVDALARRYRRIHADLGGPLPRNLPPADSVPASTGLRGELLEPCDLDRLAARISDAAALIRALRSATRCRNVGQTAPTARGIPWIRARRARAVVGRGVVFLFSVAPRTRGDARMHVAVHVALRRVPLGSPSSWLQWLAAPAANAAAAAAPSAAGLRETAVEREHDLLAEADEAERHTRRRWQPSLFDRRAAAVIDAARTVAAERRRTHAERLRELTAPDATAPLVEPLLALIVE
jgi:superfamily II DNA or RNA helicase